MAWHSTGLREELLLCVAHPLTIDVVQPRQHIQHVLLQPGQSLWLPPQTIHRVANQGRRPARYVYVTGPRSPA
jgi:mannose-6-phosphate isomerase-like protein (cupin superfamily)